MNERVLILLAGMVLLCVWTAIFATVFSSQLERVRKQAKDLSHRKLEWLRELSTHFTLVGGSAALFMDISKDKLLYTIFSIIWTVGFLLMGYMLTLRLELHDRKLAVDMKTKKTYDETRG